MSHVPCPLSHVFCLMSPVSWCLYISTSVGGVVVVGVVVIVVAGGGGGVDDDFLCVCVFFIVNELKGKCHRP